MLSDHCGDDLAGIIFVLDHLLLLMSEEVIRLNNKVV